MFDFKLYLELKRKQVNNALNEFFNLTSHSNRIAEVMRYSVMAGGKRLRPILCIAGAEAVNGYNDDVLKAACALEMIHTYSLIHDDLPAIDDDNLRRGKLTSHVKFDEATAILAGDALLTLAFQVLSSSYASNNDHVNFCLSTKWLEVISCISNAAGHNGMIEGQMRDIAYEGMQINLADLEKMHSLKTGALIEASVCSGAILGNGLPIQIDQLKLYAKNIGLAFQVTDDILNIEGDPKLLGKAVGTDAAHGKNTYPLLMGIDKSKKYAVKLIDKALQAIENFDSKSDPLRKIAQYILTRNR